jgi:Effector Associated Constant Component 1
MPDDGPVGLFEFAVDAHNDEYHSDDDRWRDQVATLYAQLRVDADVVHRGVAVPGAKGSVDEVIVALGSAGAFTAVVECFRAWLGRDRSRRIEVAWTEGANKHVVSLTGDAVDIDSVREIARAAAARIGGAAWPAPTELS